MIAGPSASGKSTLAREVADRLGFRCLSLDDMHIAGAKAYVETVRGQVRTYERPQLYDGDRLADIIRHRTTDLVVEGFCLYTYPRLLSSVAWRFYLDVPFDICARRRRARRPQRPSDESFALIGESENARIVLPQRHLPCVRILNGLRPTAELAEFILEEFGAHACS